MVYAGMLVARGRIPGMVSRSDKPWDTAALKVIVEEAGGRVTDLYGEDPRWDGPVRGCIVSATGVHGAYRALIDEARGRVTERVERAIESAGLTVTLRGTLKSHPGCVHWHVKREREPGTLELTHFPRDGRSDLQSREKNRAAPWIPEARAQLEALLACLKQL